MASESTTKPFVVDRGTSGGKNYYNIDVTTLANGGAERELYRTDKSGSNRVLVQRVRVDKDGKITADDITSNATVDERRDLKRVSSTLKTGVKTAVNSVKDDLVANNVDGTSASTIEKTAFGSGNEAINVERGLTAGEPVNVNANFDLDPNSFDITVSDRKTNYENLFYPQDIATTGQDRIKFTMFFQSGRSVGFDLERGDNPLGLGTRTITNISGSVTLPIQGDIKDTNAVEYDRATLNPITGGLASIAMNPQGAGRAIANVINAPNKLTDALSTQEGSNIINALKVFLAQSAVGTSGLIPRVTGAILNPNIELLLKAPTLRTFQFSFRMSARDEDEARQIRKIIRFFKQGMSVKRSNTSLFIVTPNLFKIQYLAGNDDGGFRDHPSIGKIKNCALSSINTQYTPDGTYMTYDDNARTMTSYSINMTFTELEPLTETDYIQDVARDDEIGF
jgi:hypothetical protein